MNRPYDRIIEKIDEETDPSRMSKEEYKDLLSELISDLQIRLDASNQEDA